MGKVSVKVPEGKLVQVETEFDDVLQDISITGDFFVEPPEALEEVEKCLIGLSEDFCKSDVFEAVEDVDAELIGFSAEHIAECLKKVVDE